jgi:peroxiredoxin
VPNVVAAYKKLHVKGLEIVGISLDSNKDKLLEFTKQKEMTWPQYFDGKTWDNKISGTFGVGAIPAMWLVDKRGYVRSTNARDDFEGQVTKLLAE